MNSQIPNASIQGGEPDIDDDSDDSGEDAEITKQQVL